MGLIPKGGFSKGRTTILEEERRTSLTQQLVLEPPRSIMFELIRHIWIIASQTLGLRDDVAGKQCIQSYRRKKDIEDLRRALKFDSHREQIYPCDDVATF